MGKENTQLGSVARAASWRGKVIPAVGCGRGMWSALDMGPQLPQTSAALPSELPLRSQAACSCLEVVSPVRTSLPEGFLCLGKGKAGSAGAGLTSLPSPSLIPALPSSWEELSDCARTCRDFVLGMFPPGIN